MYALLNENTFITPTCEMCDFSVRSGSEGSVARMSYTVVLPLAFELQHSALFFCNAYSAIDWSKTATNGLKKQTVNQGVSSSSNSLQSNSNSTHSTTLLVNNDCSGLASGNGMYVSNIVFLKLVSILLKQFYLYWHF